MKLLKVRTSGIPLFQTCCEIDFLALQRVTEENAEKILLMMTAEASRAFEKLPILENVDILRNILYAGIWEKYEMRKSAKERQKEEK